MMFSSRMNRYSKATALVLVAVLVGSSQAQTSTPGTPANDSTGGQQTLQNKTLDLPPFTGISLCAPISIVVSPSDAKGEEASPTTLSVTKSARDQNLQYEIMLEAEQDVIDGIGAEVDDLGMLSITTTGNFSTNNVIKLNVSLPQDKLASLVHNGIGEQIYLRIFWLIVPSLSLQTCGFGVCTCSDVHADALEILVLSPCYARHRRCSTDMIV